MSPINAPLVRIITQRSGLVMKMIVWGWEYDNAQDTGGRYLLILIVGAPPA